MFLFLLTLFYKMLHLKANRLVYREAKGKFMKKVYISIIALIIGLTGVFIVWKDNSNRAANVEIYDELQENHVSILARNEPVVDEDDILQIPVDFEELKAINEDIYAWIDIEDTNIHYPIVQSATDDSYYLEHTIEHVKGLPGSIYTERINSKDFSDFNTLIYGHDMRDGSMFKHVHKFADPEFFKEHETIMIYTEEEVLEYRIYAAVVYDNRHIMYSYDKENAADSKAFIKSLTETSNTKNQYREGMEIDENSKLITLSTCITGQPERRFILVAELVSKRGIV